MDINHGARDEWWESTGKHYRELADALVSRPLTVAELSEVGRIGYHLLCPILESYNPEEKQRMFAALLSIQESIQIATSRMVSK